MIAEFAHIMPVAGRQVLVTTNFEEGTNFLFIEFEVPIGRANLKIAYPDADIRDTMFIKLREGDDELEKALGDCVQAFIERTGGEMQ